MNAEQVKSELSKRLAELEVESDHPAGWNRFIGYLLAANSQTDEGPDFADGPDEEGFKGPRPYNGFTEAKDDLRSLDPSTYYELKSYEKKDKQ